MNANAKTDIHYRLMYLANTVEDQHVGEEIERGARAIEGLRDEAAFLRSEITFLRSEIKRLLARNALLRAALGFCAGLSLSMILAMAWDLLP